MSMSKVNAYAASRQKRVQIISNNSPANAQNGDGIKDVKKAPPSPPVTHMGKVGTIITTKAECVSQALKSSAFLFFIIVLIFRIIYITYSL